jgi:hypothetical protein
LFEEEQPWTYGSAAFWPFPSEKARVALRFTAPPPVPLDAPFTFHSTRDAFRSCLAVGHISEQPVCDRLDSDLLRAKPSEMTGQWGLSREPAPHLSFGITAGIIPQELA